MTLDTIRAMPTPELYCMALGLWRGSARHEKAVAAIEELARRGEGAD